jgi:hypothetical protein
MTTPDINSSPSKQLDAFAEAASMKSTFRGAKLWGFLKGTASNTGIVVFPQGNSESSLGRNKAGWLLNAEAGQKGE